VVGWKQRMLERESRLTAQALEAPDVLVIPRGDLLVEIRHCRQGGHGMTPRTQNVPLDVPEHSAGTSPMYRVAVSPPLGGNPPGQAETLFGTRQEGGPEWTCR
jgi:hypothetical protein